MATSTVIQVRVDESLKQGAELLFEEIGLDLPSAIRLFLKQALLHNGIPFAISGVDGFFNEHNQKVLSASIRPLEQGKTVLRSMADLDTITASGH